ncbi:MAG TPA: SDR family oxidoreductase, partial [Solirubrobacterales bacterium]|nr:SDR family oxidoreductase [Solirubrobacterales bacterium]
GLSKELGPAGVRVNAVAPGPTATPLWLAPGGLLDQNAARAGEEREEALAAAGERLPLGRLASAEEIAAAVVALLAPTAPTGAIWSVDGGHVPDVL